MIHWRQYKFNHIYTEDTIFTIDTEVSSYWIRPDESIAAYDPSVDTETYNDVYYPGAVCYIWMIGINDTVIYGRELDELPEVLQRIVEKSVETPVIYCHNLAYDFQFFRNVLTIEDDGVFARTVRKVIRFYANNCEFRCSYVLTGLSLEAWADSLNLEVQKQVGLLDYNVLRSPLTPLDEDALKYCKYDILVMYYGLKRFLAKYEHISKIPLTQTGEVRIPVKKMFENNNSHHWKMTELQPDTVNRYKQLRAVFAGGETHASRLHSAKIHKNVGSWDKTSDYPYQMVVRKFPYSKFVETSPDLRFLKPETYAYILELKLEGVKCRTNNTYIARSHCVAVKHGTYDNGRVISAEMIALCITELDWLTINEMYDIEKVTVIKVLRSRKRYLPKVYIEYILELYAYKTSLKNVKGKEDIYNQSKQFINSLYGMMVTDIIMPDVHYIDNQWQEIQYLNDDGIQERLDKIHERFWANNLSYQFGVWVTAYARRELMEMVIALDADEVYHDTDSVKAIHYQKYMDLFKSKNAEMDLLLHEVCDFYEIDFEKTRPRKKNGKGAPAPLGHWDFETVYRRFRTLGAKKYCVNYSEKDIRVTVSGVPKKQGSALVKHIKQFKDGFVFDRDLCGKKMLTYLDGNNREITLPDGYKMHHPFAINMRNNGYSLNITPEYAQIIYEINEFKGFLGAK